MLDLKTLRPVKSFIHVNRLEPFKHLRDYRPPTQNAVNNDRPDDNDQVDGNQQINNQNDNNENGNNNKTQHENKDQ